jgi:hypothetical protein
MRYALLFVALPMALVAAVPSGSAATLPNSGLRGLITIGSCPGPAQQAGDPPRCDEGPTPFEGEVRVLRQRDGVEVGRFRSRPSDGRFRIRLPRGRYELDPLEVNGGLHKGTILVKVQRGEFTRLRMHYDNGAS